MAWAILDSNIYIDYWERGLHEALIERLSRQFIIRHSSVVMSELRRGARALRARKLVDALRRTAPDPWDPEDKDWWEAGKLVRLIGDLEGWDATKRRDFQNDALIALTARNHGAALVTANHRDFELLRRMLHFVLITPDKA